MLSSQLKYDHISYKKKWYGSELVSNVSQSANYVCATRLSDNVLWHEMQNQKYKKASTQIIYTLQTEKVKYIHIPC